MVPGPNGPQPLNAGCSACHNNKGPGSDGNEPDQVYSDYRLPQHRPVPLIADLSRDDEDPGLAAHDDLPG